MAEPIDYAEFREFADELLAEFGADAKIAERQQTGAAHKPETTLVELATVKAAVIAYDNRVIDGTRIRTTDKRGLVSAEGLDFVIKASHRFIQNDESGTAVVYEIVNSQSIRPASTTVLYDLQLRA